MRNLPATHTQLGSARQHGCCRVAFNQTMHCPIIRSSPVAAVQAHSAVQQNHDVGLCCVSSAVQATLVLSLQACDISAGLPMVSSGPLYFPLLVEEVVHGSGARAPYAANHARNASGCCSSMVSCDAKVCISLPGYNPMRVCKSLLGEAERWGAPEGLVLRAALLAKHVAQGIGQCKVHEAVRLRTRYSQTGRQQGVRPARTQTPVTHTLDVSLRGSVRVCLRA